MPHFILLALIGWGIASWALLRVIWMPDPPPDALARFVVTSIVGMGGAILGGALAGGFASSNPMPGEAFVAGIAGALGFVTALRAVSVPRALIR